jgi:hypothetical protein
MDKQAANNEHSCFIPHTTHEFQNKVAFFKVGDKFTVLSLHQETIPSTPKSVFSPSATFQHSVLPAIFQTDVSHYKHSV